MPHTLPYCRVRAGSVTFGHRHGRVSNRIAEQRGEAFVARIIPALLAPKEHPLVARAGILDRLHGGTIKIAGKCHAPDFGADAAGHWNDIERRIGRWRRTGRTASPHRW